jgi:hypothetical protein
MVCVCHLGGWIHLNGGERGILLGDVGDFPLGEDRQVPIKTTPFHSSFQSLAGLDDSERAFHLASPFGFGHTIVTTPNTLA